MSPTGNSKQLTKRERELQKIKNTRSFIKYSRISTRIRKYFILSNGYKPFYVTVGIPKYDETPVITIYGHVGFDSEYNHIYKKVKTVRKFIGYWYGFDSSNCRLDGNSLLIKLSSRTYLNVNHTNIVKFTFNEPILDYISPVGNNDVPYPVAYTSNYVIFLLDNVYVPKDALRLKATVLNSEDIYGEFYGHLFRQTHQNIVLNKHPLNIKTLIELKLRR